MSRPPGGSSPSEGTARRAERLRLWLERGGSGYRLRDAASGERVEWEDPRIRVVPLAGASYRAVELADAAFAPGSRLSLVPEPDNPHDGRAIGVWDETRRLQGGYLPADTARDVRSEEWQAFALWGFHDGSGRRVGLRILLAPADAWVGQPRTT